MACSPRIPSSPRNSLGNVRPDMDITYPEHLSRLNRHLVVEWSKPKPKNKRATRQRNRHRTQPVTFDEIQEVDEETLIVDNADFDAELRSNSLKASMDLDFNFYKITKALDMKLKKSKLESGGNKAEPIVNPIQTKALEQLRRTETNREGSV